MGNQTALGCLSTVLLLVGCGPAIDEGGLGGDKMSPQPQNVGGEAAGGGGMSGTGAVAGTGAVGATGGSAGGSCEGGRLPPQAYLCAGDAYEDSQAGLKTSRIYGTSARYACQTPPSWYYYYGGVGGTGVGGSMGVGASVGYGGEGGYGATGGTGAGAYGGYPAGGTGAGGYPAGGTGAGGYAAGGTGAGGYAAGGAGAAPGGATGGTSAGGYAAGGYAAGGTGATGGYGAYGGTGATGGYGGYGAYGGTGATGGYGAYGGTGGYGAYGGTGGYGGCAGYGGTGATGGCGVGGTGMGGSAGGGSYGPPRSDWCEDVPANQQIGGVTWAVGECQDSEIRLPMRIEEPSGWYELTVYGGAEPCDRTSVLMKTSGFGTGEILEFPVDYGDAQFLSIEIKSEDWASVVVALEEAKPNN